jgi:hypothetical protein
MLMKNHTSEDWLKLLEKTTGNTSIPKAGIYEDIEFDILIDSKQKPADQTGKYLEFVQFGNTGLSQSISSSQPQNFQTIDIRDIGNNGGYAWLEIATAIKRLESNMSRSDSEPFNFIFSIGDGFYLQMTKLAAFRSVSRKLFPKTVFSISAEPASYNKYISDENNNLVRATAEYIAAALGGAEYLIETDSLKYDKKESLRLSKNTIDLIKYESAIDKPALYWQGSEVLSQIAYKIGEKAWNYLKENENVSLDVFEAQVIDLCKTQMENRKDQIHRLKVSKIGYNIYRSGNPVELFVLGDAPDIEVIEDMKKHGFNLLMNVSDSYESLILAYELSSTSRGLVYSSTASQREMSNLIDELTKVDKVAKKGRRPAWLKGSFIPKNIIKAIVEEGHE